jgi:tetraacyldisaccharide 4'-kinase
MNRLARFHRRLTFQGAAGPLEKLLLFILVPAAWLYGAIGWLRVLLYRNNVFPVYRSEIPVISVGNLSVGGTGKTPMVDYLAKFFLGRGKKVAVVSRGYGARTGPGVQVVCRGAGPLLGPGKCGDEPFLLARRNPTARVYVSPRRREGIRLAAEQGAEVVILDDGFQHLAVARDLDIVLLDAGFPLGNGRVLPAGNLREFPGALRRGDLFLLTRCEEGDASPAPALPGPVCRCRHVLAETAVSLAGEAVPLTGLAGRKCLAFAGIANPEGFFSDLAEKGLKPCKVLHFPDHAVYDKNVTRSIMEAAKGMDFLLTTEKDGGKLRAEDFPIPCYQVPLGLDFPEMGPLEKHLREFI